MLNFFKNIGNRKTIDDASSIMANNLACKTSELVDHEDVIYTQQDAALDMALGMGLQNASKGGSYCLTVVEHPDLPQRVYKVCNANPADDPYILYAEWLLETRIFEDNPHFPRIHEIVYSSDGMIAVVVSEKLDEVVWSDAHEFIKADWRIYYNTCFDRDTRNLSATYLDNKAWLLQNDHNNPPLSRASKMVFEKFKEHPDVFFDSHKGNVMLRGNIVVLIDPLALTIG